MKNTNDGGMFSNLALPKVLRSLVFFSLKCFTTNGMKNTNDGGMFSNLAAWRCLKLPPWLVGLKLE